MQHQNGQKLGNKPISHHQLWVFLGSFLACWFLTELGLWFDNPFGLTSVIWPVTGTMLGLYLIFGWPVALASSIALFISYSQNEFFDTLPIEYALLLAVVSMSHLIFVKWLVFRYFTLPLKTGNPFEIIRFLILTGPVSALFFALIMGLVLMNCDLETSIVFYISVTRWVGDLFSIIFITPVMLFAYENNIVRKARKPLAATITSALAYTMICFMFSVSQANFEHEKQQQFINSTTPFVERVNSAQSTIKLYLKALEAFFQANPHISWQEFNDFTARVQDEKVQIRAIGWLPLVLAKDKPKFEQMLVDEQFKNQKIKQLTSAGFQDAEHQPFYLPIHYLAPLTGNQSAIGLDVVSHPIAGPAVKAAIAQRTFVVTPLLSLAQQQNKTTGVVVYYPVYFKNQAPSMQSLIGVAEVVLELEILLDPPYSHIENRAFSYQLSYDESNIYPLVNKDNAYLLTHPVEFWLFDKKGKINFFSTDIFELGLLNWSSFLIVFVGIVLGVVCVMFVFFIVSYNSRLSKKINESTQELQIKNNELVKANEAKNLFLANISHEYRTPLNAIMGFSEIAKGESKEQHTRNYLEKIHDASTLLLSIVNDVLDFSKMQAGQLALDKCVFNPAKVSDAVIEMLDEKARTKGIVFNATYDENFSTLMEGDDLRYKQILINLLSNAIKFTDEGSVSLKGTAKIKGDTCFLTLCISDTGIGIATEHQSKLFQSFSQAESTTTRKYGGTGLGLSIVKQLSNLMGGDVILKSQVGKGSQFIVTLQLDKASEPIAELLHTEQLINEVDLSHMHILVVEDNKINQIIVEKHLENLSVKCDLANDGQDALVYLQTHTPDLILMDLQMPNMDGFTASKLIKENERLHTVPIVILSASVGKLERDKAKELGIDDFINKPFNQAELKAILAKYHALG